MLPGVTLHLGLPPAPARALVDAGAAVALGTGCNPGSSPLFSAALGLGDRGWRGPGGRADFLVLDAADWRELPYALGRPVAARTVVGGASSAGGACAALS